MWMELTRFIHQRRCDGGKLIHVCPHSWCVGLETAGSSALLWKTVTEKVRENKTPGALSQQTQAQPASVITERIVIWLELVKRISWGEEGWGSTAPAARLNHNSSLLQLSTNFDALYCGSSQTLPIADIFHCLQATLMIHSCL